MKILVTGANGFIGKNLISELNVFDNIKISSAHSINYVKHDSVGHHK